MYWESTFAARPVGAINLHFMFSETSELTTAAIAVVLPVPAYPFTTIISASSPVRNEAMSRSRESWQEVASTPRWEMKSLYRKPPLSTSSYFLLSSPSSIPITARIG